MPDETTLINEFWRNKIFDGDVFPFSKPRAVLTLQRNSASISVIFVILGLVYEHVLKMNEMITFVRPSQRARVEYIYKKNITYTVCTYVLPNVTNNAITITHYHLHNR